MAVGKKANIRYYVESHARKHFDKFIQDNNYNLTEFYEEASNFVGVSASTIAQIRLRNLAPSFIVAQKISEFIGVPTSELWKVLEYDTVEERERCEVKGCNNTAGTHNLCMYHVNLKYRKDNNN